MFKSASPVGMGGVLDINVAKLQYIQRHVAKLPRRAWGASFEDCQYALAVYQRMSGEKGTRTFDEADVKAMRDA